MVSDEERNATMRDALNRVVDAIENLSLALDILEAEAHGIELEAESLEVLADATNTFIDWETKHFVEMRNVIYTKENS